MLRLLIHFAGLISALVLPGACTGAVGPRPPMLPVGSAGLELETASFDIYR